MVLEIASSSRSVSRSGGVAPAELDEALSIFVFAGCDQRPMRSRLQFVCDYPDGKPVEVAYVAQGPVSILLPHLS